MEGKTIQPNELWQRLIELDSEKFNGNIPDIYGFASAFKKCPNSNESQMTKHLFEVMLEIWDDAQVVEFIEIFTDNKVATSSMEELRNELRKAYIEIFE